MTLTIHLTPEPEQRLTAEAGPLGEDAERLAERVLAGWLEHGEQGSSNETAPSADVERRRRLQSFLATARANAAMAGYSDEVDAEVQAICDEVRAEHFRRFQEAEQQH